MFVAKLGFSDVSPGLLLWFIVTRPACHIKVDLDNDYLSSQSDVSDASNATNHGPHKPATSLQGHIKIDLAVSLQHPCLVTWDERLKKVGNLWDWPNIAGFLWRYAGLTHFFGNRKIVILFSEQHLSCLIQFLQDCHLKYFDCIIREFQQRGSLFCHYLTDPCSSCLRINASSWSTSLDIRSRHCLDKKGSLGDVT